MEVEQLKQVRQQLHNHTEDVVIHAMESILEDKKFSNVCKCDQCLLDMASYALNRLPAKYTATQKGNIITKLDEFEQQLNVDVISTVTKAINLVSRDPNHD